MLLKISEMPATVRLSPVLLANRIKRPSLYLKGFPTNTFMIPAYNKDSKGTPPAELTHVLWRMVRACLVDGGIGLAAPQIGVFSRMFIVKEDSKDAFRVYIHPRFSVPFNTGREKMEEGCLSVPGKNVPVSRWSAIEAEWMEMDQEGCLLPQTGLLEGLKARVFQHEEDHLSGISILDRERQEAARSKLYPHKP